MKPRWKVVAELILALVFTLVGSGMMVRGFQGDLFFGVLPSWTLIVGGFVVMWVNLDRLHARWNEL